jgi:hypothetical protein
MLRTGAGFNWREGIRSGGAAQSRLRDCSICPECPGRCAVPPSCPGRSTGTGRGAVSGRIALMSSARRSRSTVPVSDIWRAGVASWADLDGGKAIGKVDAGGEALDRRVTPGTGVPAIQNSLAHRADHAAQIGSGELPAGERKAARALKRADQLFLSLPLRTELQREIACAGERADACESADERLRVRHSPP